MFERSLLVLNDLKIKEPKVMAKLAKKVTKAFVLKNQAYLDVDFKCDAEIRQAMLQNLSLILMNPTEKENHKQFVHKFHWQQRVFNILSVCVDWFEKDRQYPMAALVLSHMLKDPLNQSDSRKRGSWWHRLCVDLKHLKLKKECI